MKNPQTAQDQHNCAHNVRTPDKYTAWQASMYAHLDVHFPAVLQMVANGDTQSQIAAAIGRVTQADVSRWAHQLTADRLSQMIEARKAAGQGYLDRGMQILLDAKGGDANDINWAKAVAVEYARRGAIADRRLNDRAPPEPQAPASQAVPSFVINILPSNGQATGGITIDQAPDLISDADLI